MTTGLVLILRTRRRPHATCAKAMGQQARSIGFFHFRSMNDGAKGWGRVDWGGGVHTEVWMEKPKTKIELRALWEHLNGLSRLDVAKNGDVFVVASWRFGTPNMFVSHIRCPPRNTSGH